MTIPPPGPLAYEGIVAVPFVRKTFDPPVPSSPANEPFDPPTIWVNTSSGEAWILTQNPLSNALWVPLGHNDVGGILTINDIEPDVDQNFVISSDGSIQIVDGTAEITVQLQGLTNHSLLAGAGTTTITKIAPSATSGIPVISQGVSADPVFGTAVVAGGGTGRTSLSNHSILVGAGTSAITQILASAPVGAPLLSGGLTGDPSYSTTTVINDIGGIVTHTSSSTSEVTGFRTENTSASEFSYFLATSANRSGYYSSGQGDIPTGQYWNFGMTSNLNNSWALNYSPVGSDGPEGGSIVHLCTKEGANTYPLQPSFSASLATNTANDKTGDGTLYTVGTDALTEAFDQSAAFNTNGTITFQVDGKYRITGNVTLNNVGAAHTDAFIQFVPSAGLTIQSSFLNPSSVRDSTGRCTLAFSFTVSQIAASTGVIQVSVSGDTKTVGIYGNANPATFISGELIN